jgi:hypothetical protein
MANGGKCVVELEADTSATAVVRGSWSLLLLAGIAMAVSLASWLVGAAILGPVARHLFGWAAASLLGFTFVVAHRREIERLRHDEPGFVLDARQLRAGTALLSVGVLLCGVHAWFLATELAS